LPELVFALERFGQARDLATIEWGELAANRKRPRSIEASRTEQA